jgi:ABC-type transport system involved in cytochrome c biogenesis permease subunit
MAGPAFSRAAGVCRTGAGASTVTTIGIATLALYLASFVFYVWFLAADRRLVGLLATGSLALGLVGHYFWLLARSHWSHSIPYDDLYGSMALFGWLLAATYLVLEFRYHQRSMGAFVLPVVTALYFAATLGRRDPLAEAPAARGPLFALHITLNILAYSGFALAFVLSLTYLIQSRLLRSRRLARLVWRFPALDGLDRMSRGSVKLGLAALVVGTALGLMWQHRLRGSYWSDDPKVLITFAILALYAGYLWLSRSTAWRGARASALCVANFVLVIFSYTVVNVYLSRFHHYF